jgi:hypothetical protein
MTNSFIITPDRFLDLANNYIARNRIKLELKPENKIFFLHSDNIPVFMARVLPQINYKFILITHDADAPVTNQYLSILNNENLVMWFGMNCHTIHKKLFPIPIGMANEVWPHGNKDTVIKIIKEKNDKKNFCYCNFDINTNHNARFLALQKLKEIPFIDFEKEKLDFETYLRKLSTYKYVISPPGNSVDCHRIWESMYVGTIPICLKSVPLHTFKNSPILFIDKWSDITQELLESKYEKTIQKDTTVCDFNYYKDTILDLAKSL